jgi:hypothetical protein
VAVTRCAGGRNCHGSMAHDRAPAAAGAVSPSAFTWGAPGVAFATARRHLERAATVHRVGRSRRLPPAYMLSAIVKSL